MIYSAATRIFLDIKVSLSELDDLTALLGGITGTVTNSSLLNGLLDTLGGLLGGLGLGDAITLDSLLAGDEILHLPLYIELGAAEASATSISPTSVVFNATTGLTKAFIGDIDETFFTAETLNEADFAAAELLNLSGLVKIAAKAYVYSSSGTAVALTYNVSNLPQTQSVYAPAGSDINTLLMTLLGNLDLYVTVLGLNLDQTNYDLLTGGLVSTLSNQILQPVGNVILNPLSNLLGIYAGRADLTLDGPF